MKIREKSFLSAVLAFALVLSVGTAFATAAPDAVEETAPTVFSGDVMQSQDGTTVYVFTAEGKPVSMTQQEYNVLFDPVDVECWTAEEYAEWLEQEKKDLQDCLGQRAWTNTDGWFTWTQEKIDETIEMYERILEEIENGLLVSKTVDGRGDIGLMEDGREMLFSSEDGMVMYKYDDTDTDWTVRIMTMDEAAAMQEQIEAVAEKRRQLTLQLSGLDEEQAQLELQLAKLKDAKEQLEQETTLTALLDQWDETLTPYAPFGVTYEYDEETDDVRLYWNGERIRGIYDATEGVWITAHSGNGTWPEGTPELAAVYEDGELIGLRLATAAEQEQWDRLRTQADTSGQPE